MTTQTSTTPAADITAAFGHCLELARLSMDKGFPHGMYRPPDDEPPDGRRRWLRLGAGTPPPPDAFVIVTTPEPNSYHHGRNRFRPRTTARVTITVADESLDDFITDSLKAILPSGEVVYRQRDKGVLALFGFYYRLA